MMSASRLEKKQKNVWDVNRSKRVSTSLKNGSCGEPSSTEIKFKEAQQKLQAAVAKYAKDYESSSSEDELESENVIDGILKKYSKVGGVTELFKRTQTFLEDALNSGAATCLICIGTIKRVDKIWSCNTCYCFFHLQCIERWSKDSVVQQKEALREQARDVNVDITWGCPKCRFEYNSGKIPREYLCFCAKTLNPPFQPWLVPHSCGDICKKKLQPLCGHECLILCHPGPCPPCPKTVTVSCYCGGKFPRMQRCSNKEWSCGTECQKMLGCGQHRCSKSCHPGECSACSEKSMLICQCGAEEQLRDCAFQNWQCTKICDYPLSCGHHKCQKICHRGTCGDCSLTQPRQCPCGKTLYKLLCTEETPTCGDTCEKMLECGAHRCNHRCHKNKCSTCLELAVKSCRCGLHRKEVQCKKQFLCETKCRKLKDCNRHPCNRKCCDGSCPPCEKPCGRTLPCGLHKCTSVCHRGPCYPCILTSAVHCRCGLTSLTVPCGRKKKTKPPRCNRPCMVSPDCHHGKREIHRCHFGDCPPCKQICARTLSCQHICAAPCHSAVMIKIEVQKATMPWEETGPIFSRKCLPCPDCNIKVKISCLGGHTDNVWFCCAARKASCCQPCGRILACSNHKCESECHVVENASDNSLAGSNCETCHKACEFPRPKGCPHSCPGGCHAGLCPPCKRLVRLKCHCGLNQLYVWCSEWTKPGMDGETLQSCGNQCPKNVECGHRCKIICHSGVCSNPKQCRKKVKIFCACKRIKKEVPCEYVRKNLVSMECDGVCKSNQEEMEKVRETELEAKRREEELRDAKELEQYEKKFQGKKKYKEKKRKDEAKQNSFLKNYWMLIVVFFVLVVAVYIPTRYTSVF